ncbi:hypothetical protein GF371_02560 [Candidatus Woesearchaeota archaeon]|nr:hypothetical protein [Candidatus Woesearchaeota archaeon]
MVKGIEIGELQKKLREGAFAISATPAQRRAFEERWYAVEAQRNIYERYCVSVPSNRDEGIHEIRTFRLYIKPNASAMAKAWFDEPTIFRGIELEKRGDFIGYVKDREIIVPRFIPLSCLVNFPHGRPSPIQNCTFGLAEDRPEIVKPYEHHVLQSILDECAQLEKDGFIRRVFETHSHPYGPSGNPDPRGPSISDIPGQGKIHEVNTAKTWDGEPAFGFSYNTAIKEGMFFVLTDWGKSLFEYKFIGNGRRPIEIKWD